MRSPRSSTRVLSVDLLALDVARPVLIERDDPACGCSQDQARRRVRAALHFFTFPHSQLFAQVSGLLRPYAPYRHHFTGVGARETSILLHHARELMQVKGPSHRWFSSVQIYLLPAYSDGNGPAVFSSSHVMLAMYQRPFCLTSCIALMPRPCTARGVCGPFS